MERRTRNLAAYGLLTVISTALFFWLLYYLLGNPLFRGGLDLVVALDDGAGLKRGDRVQVQGVEVGSVTEVDFDRMGGVVVDIQLRGDLVLPTDSRANVIGDVFGAHTLQLILGRAVVSLEDGDTIRGAPVPALTDLASDLGARAQALLTSADSLFSPETVADVQATAAVLPSTAEEMRAMFVELRHTAEALRRTAEKFEGMPTEDLVTGASNVIDEFQRSAAAMTDMVNSMTDVAGAMEQSMTRIASVMGKIDDGQGTIGLLVNDTSLYYTLQTTVREMGALVTDIRERPTRYFTIRVFQ